MLYNHRLLNLGIYLLYTLPEVMVFIELVTSQRSWSKLQNWKTNVTLPYLSGAIPRMINRGGKDALFVWSVLLNHKICQVYNKKQTIPSNATKEH